MSRGFVALLLAATLVISGGASALVSWAVTSSALGAQGSAGADGASGAEGSDGAPGDAGTAGADGEDGADGATGPRGSNGSQGPAGLRGAVGAVGPVGPQGAPGAPGADGADALIDSVSSSSPDALYLPTATFSIGAPFVVEAAPVVLVAWQFTVRPDLFSQTVTCSLVDTLSGDAYAASTFDVTGAAASSASGSGVVSLAADSVLELTCTPQFAADLWAVTGIRAYALTFAV